MASNNDSYFSYNLSRPYPFRWFTPAALLGGTVLAILFSVLNFAANGYALGSILVADPNSTLAEKAWFQKAPFSYQSKLSASCQSANIASGTELTAKSGFQYQLGDVWTEDETGAVVPLPSLAYLNNSLTDCTFRGVQIFLFNYDPQSNGPYWNWNRDSSASAYVTCSINNGQLPTHLNLSVTIKNNLQGSPADDAYGFLTAQRQKQGSLWFGQLLMWLNFNQILFQMGQVDSTNVGLLTGSGMYITRNSSQQNSLENDFMEISDGYEAFYTLAGGDFYGVGGPPLTELQYGDTNIGQAVDYFTRSFYSFIMADLGQTSKPNVLTSLKILNNFWTASDSAINHIDPGNFAPPGSLGANTFETLKQTTGPILISNATLNAEYLCQVPQRKNITSIIVAVVVADIVFLQTAWGIFNWIVTVWVEKESSEAKYCTGCAQYLASSAATNDGTDGPAGSYEMLSGRVTGSRAKRYAKFPYVHLGNADDDDTRRVR